MSDLFNVDAECYVLAAAVGSAGRTLSVGELRATDFYDEPNRRVFEILLARVEAHEPIEPSALLPVLAAVPGVGADWLAKLLEIAAVPSSAGYYAEIVRAKATARAILAASQRVAQQVRELDDAADMLEAANAASQSMLNAAQRGRSSQGVVEDLRDVMDGLENPTRYVATPWPDLDHAIGGWAAGRLYVIGARPGIGKSLIGVCAQLHAARHGNRAFFASVEMSKQELYLRMIANAGKVDHGKLQRGGLNDDDWLRIATAEDEIKHLPIHVADDVQRPAEIIARAQGIIRDHGPLGLLVVDYVQLMTSISPKQTRQEQVAEFSRSLKLAAKSLNVPVIALAQLNRDAVGRRPAMSDLRESGALEQDADLVMLLHRDNDEHPDVLEMMVAKNRHGTTGAVDLYFQGKYQRIESMAPKALKAVQ